MFQLALTKPAEKRTDWLERECGEDKALCVRVAALLAAHEQPDELLTAPAEEAAATMKIEFAEEERRDETLDQILGRYKLLEKVGEGAAAWSMSPSRLNRCTAGLR